MLISRKVYLAPLCLGDVGKLFKWINQRRDVVFNSPYRPVTMSQHRKWYETVTRSRDIAIFGIHNKTGHGLIGVCQLHSISHVHRSAELQIRIGDDEERGKGYGGEAVRLLVGFAFSDLNLERVGLHVFSTNKRALGLYAKTGFKVEGRLRKAAYIDGVYVDIILMGLMKDEWAHR